MSEQWFELFDQFNAAWVWQLLKDNIQQQIFNSHPITVPYLAEARRYNLGSLVLKVSSDKSQGLVKALDLRRMLSSRLEDYAVVGPLDQFMSSDTKSVAREKLLMPLPYGEVKGDIFVYHFAKTENGVVKEIELQIHGYERWAIAPFGCGEVFLDLDRVEPFVETKPPRRALVIDEVFYTRYLYIKMRINDTVEQFELPMCPLAFLMTEYSVDCRTGGLTPQRAHNALSFYGRFINPTIESRRTMSRFYLEQSQWPYNQSENASAPAMKHHTVEPVLRPRMYSYTNCYMPIIILTRQSRRHSERQQRRSDVRTATPSSTSSMACRIPSVEAIEHRPAPVRQSISSDSLDPQPCLFEPSQPVIIGQYVTECQCCSAQQCNNNIPDELRGTTYTRHRKSASSFIAENVNSLDHFASDLR